MQSRNKMKEMNLVRKDERFCQFEVGGWGGGGGLMSHQYFGIYTRAGCFCGQRTCPGYLYPPASPHMIHTKQHADSNLQDMSMEYPPF